MMRNVCPLLAHRNHSSGSAHRPLFISKRTMCCAYGRKGRTRGSILKTLGAASVDQAAFSRKLFAPLPLPSEPYVTPSSLSFKAVGWFSSRRAF